MSDPFGGSAISTEAAPDQRHLQQLAEEIFALTVLSYRTGMRSRQNVDLSESQFLTLDLLSKADRYTVGELQRAINVLPAQMSRIIRALETNFEQPLIQCALNPEDKRKIDVTITSAGKKVYEEFRDVRLARSVATLAALPEQDRQEFVRICRKIQDLYRQEANLKAPESATS